MNCDIFFIFRADDSHNMKSYLAAILWQFKCLSCFQKNGQNPIEYRKKHTKRGSYCANYLLVEQKVWVVVPPVENGNHGDSQVSPEVMMSWMVAASRRYTCVM